MDYIITKNRDGFSSIGKYSFCELQDMVLPQTIAFDTETTGLDSLKDEIFSIQIGTGKNNYLIDLQDYSSGLFPLHTIRINEVLPYILGKTLVGHNISFDLGFLYKYGYYPSEVEDTMIGSMLYHNGDDRIFSHSFGNVMHRELGIDYDKSEQNNIHITRLSTARAIQYCFNDVDKLLALRNDLVNKLGLVGSIETYMLNCNFLKSLVYMERCGLPISTSMWTSKMVIDKKEATEAAQKIVEYIYDNLPKYRDRQLDLFDTTKKVNLMLSSNKQMIPVFQSLGIPCKDDEGKDSIKENIINKSEHDFVKLWLDYKGAEHNVTTFGQSILDKEEKGRIYTHFKPLVNTCRIATRKGYINFLNFPSGGNTRDCFQASPGYKMVVADYEGQENVCSAMLTKDEAMLDSLNKGFDLHCMFARVIFPEIKHMLDSEIKDNHSEKRDFSKAPRFNKKDFGFLFKNT